MNSGRYLRPRKYKAIPWFSLLLQLHYGAVALLQDGGSLAFSGDVEVIPIGCLYHLVPKAIRSLIICLTCPPTSHGKRLINGQRHTVCPALIRTLYTHCVQLIGDMVFFKILGQPFLVLGSVERTYDLFEKRSSNYSDRPRFPMFNEMSVVFSPFMSGHAHWKAGWILHGTWLSVNTGPSGGTIVVPSMIISIQTSSTSIIRLK